MFLLAVRRFFQPLIPSLDISTLRNGPQLTMAQWPAASSPCEYFTKPSHLSWPSLFGGVKITAMSRWFLFANVLQKLAGNERLTPKFEIGKTISKVYINEN
jgi:hypothetical protein